jgi:hypothetical protein
MKYYAESISIILPHFIKEVTEQKNQTIPV